MARLAKHELDVCRVCRSCLAFTEARYDGAQVVEAEDGTLCEARQYTCQAPGCGQTYFADLEPRPTFTDADLLRVTDRREWSRKRLLNGTLTVLTLPEGGGRYAVCADMRDY